MPITTPIGHGTLDATVKWNRPPPLYYKTLFEQDVIISQGSGQFEALSIDGLQHQLLPEQGGLHGLALMPRQEHYHNFIFPYGSSNDVYPDNNHIVNDLQSNGKQNLIDFFGWKVINGWYREIFTDENGNDRDITPLVHGVDYNDETFGSSDPITEYEERRQRGAKWGYKLQSVPIHEFGQTGSGLTMFEEKVSKLVLHQSQLNSSENGPTGIGVHWGLQRKIDIPYGLGFVLDFYINKDIDPLTSDANVIDSQTGQLKDFPFSKTNYQNAFTKTDVNINNEDIFTGNPPNFLNSSFYFINKSYIIIQITGNSTSGNCFFIVITSDAHAKLFQVYETEKSDTGTMSKGYVKLLSEYNPVSGDATSVSSGLRMLRGDSGHLKLQIRQIMNHIIIENNVFSTPWVINLSAYKHRSSTNSPSSTTGRVEIPQIGGRIKIFGGNISTGVSFSHLNYYDETEVLFEDIKVYGTNRTIYTRLSSHGANGMDARLKTGDRYFPNGAQRITDYNGTHDLSSRIDQYFGGFSGSLLDPSKLIVNDSVSNSSTHTKLSTKIKLIAGTGRCTFSSGYFNLGKCITPVLQYVAQISPEVQRSISTNVTNIQDIIETIEITKEAQDYHAVSVSGSILVNAWTPSVNDDARNAVVDSIGKARYLQIDVSHNGCAALNLQAYRTGPAPGGTIRTGTGGDRSLFTGIAFNPVLTEEAGKRYIKFELKDYWVIFESKLILNSPFFDGAIDTDVIEYLADHTGFIDKSGIHSGSREAFPISLNFREPLARFKDRQTVAEAIKQTAKKYSKYAYFDNNGRFCYRRIPNVLLSGAGGTYNIKYNFYSSHIGINANIVPIGPGYLSGTSSVPNHNSQIAYNVKTTQWNNKDIFNKILLQTVDGYDNSYVVVSDANWNSLMDENSLGFLGYEKAFLQDEAAIGDINRAQLVLRYYTRMFKPVYTINWKCIGGNIGLDIFDIVSVDGRMVVIDKISHSIDAKNNSWETEYTGEWIYPPITDDGGDY